MSLDGCQCWLPFWLPAPNVTAPSGYKTVAPRLAPTGGLRACAVAGARHGRVRSDTSLAVSAGPRTGGKGRDSGQLRDADQLPDV
jgi:hypothetical protein